MTIIYRDKYTVTSWHHINRSHYENLGYKFTGWFDKFCVQSCHLTRGHKEKIWVICPGCKAERMVVHGHVLKTNHSKCMKCSRKGKHKDISGKRFGRLLVIKYIGVREKRAYWLCECDCGNETISSSKSLLNGSKQSCGCLWKDIRAEIFGKNHPMYGRRGSDCPNWNPDLTDEQREGNRRRNEPEDREWRISIFERDNFTCQVCNDDYGGNLNAHHLNSYSEFPDQRYDLSNRITLCKDCHTSFHSLYSTRGNTKDQFYNWLDNSS